LRFCFVASTRKKREFGFCEIRTIDSMKYPTGIIWWNGKLVPFALIKVVAMGVLNLKHQTNPPESAGELYSDKSSDLSSACMTKKPSLVWWLKNGKSGVKEDGLTKVSRSASLLMSFEHELENFRIWKVDDSASYRII
jgi:hypothetical protein